MRVSLNPVTLKRLAAFRNMRRAWVSLWLLLAIYIISLLANVIANDKPVIVRYAGETYFPVLHFIPEAVFIEDGRNTRPDYRQLQRSDHFKEDGNWMLWPVIPYGYNEGVKETDIDLPPEVNVTLRPKQRVAQVDTGPFGQVLRSRSTDWLGWGERGDSLGHLEQIPADFDAAILRRFENQAASQAQIEMTINEHPVIMSLSAFEPRANRPPRFVRLIIREQTEEQAAQTMVMNGSGEEIRGDVAVWAALSEDNKESVRNGVSELLNHPSRRRSTVEIGGYAVSLSREVVAFPFRPVTGHPMGLDSSGRDVLVRILYATRISLNFGFVLVLATMMFGIAAGAMQGYYGGKVDLITQRLIEIWESLPFLYILMLMGSIFGRSFFLLLICYGMFNWIGISYYMRAEFLRLRNQPFVDAARVTGLPAWKIITRHILPNSLVPVITFFPFSLVGAIGMLAAVDFLGFGLPPPVASYGELLSQGQEFPFAWWLILFPSLALFGLILLGVFIGEGLQAAFNPRRAVKWDG